MSENGQVVRVLIADDHPIFRHGLRNLLEAEPGFCVVGEAADGPEAIKLARRLKPDILLLDLAMPGASGLEALRELANSSAPVRTILLTVAIEKPQIIAALRFGARGVVLKDAASQVVIRSIRKVLDGEYWVGRECISDMVQYLRQLHQGPSETASPRRFGLTPRELEIVSTVAAGYTNKDIAQKFSLSEDTVKHHLSHIFDKLGVSNRLELAILAINHDLVRGQ